MCHFITLIAPTGDAEAIRAVMARHGRKAHPVDNPSVRKVLRDGERQYLTTGAQCDCGTVLAAPRETPDELEQKLADEAARLRRKGWSEAKIARTLDDQRKSDARPSRPGPDSLELWDQVLRDLGEDLKLSHAGLLVHVYSGSVDTEAFIATRRQTPKNVGRQDALASMAEAEVTIFPLR